MKTNEPKVDKKNWNAFSYMRTQYNIKLRLSIFYNYSFDVNIYVARSPNKLKWEKEKTKLNHDSQSQEA